MNLLHMKYAVEVAKLGSLNKAAESLLIAQPNISRSIKELESSLGISIFTRSAKGMVVTPEGEEFIGYAKNILKQIDEVEMLYHNSTVKKQRFSISVPHGSYITQAFAEFSRNIDAAPAEIFYKEDNCQRTIDNVVNNNYRLGIIRHNVDFDEYFKNFFASKGIVHELIAEFSFVLLMSKDSPLATKKEITEEDLASCIEVLYADPYIPSLSLSKGGSNSYLDSRERQIFVFERASEYELLSENPETFLWASQCPQKLLDRYGLVQRRCSVNTRRYKDLLIYRKDYKLTSLDKQFITALCNSRRRCFP